MSNTDRLEYMKAYFAAKDKVKVESPAQVSKTTQGNIVRRFNGDRAGYTFKDGITYVDRADLYKFRGQHYIIHEDENGVKK